MAGWFDERLRGRPRTTPNPHVQPQAQLGRDYGNRVYNYIATMMKEAWGRDPSQEEVQAWGTDIDSGYMDKIRQDIYSRPEAQAWAQQQNQPQQAPAPAGGGARNWAAEDYRDVNNIRAYFESRGLTGDTLERVVRTWEDYSKQPWAEEAMKNGYFFKRMEDENELTGSNARGGGADYGSMLTPFTEQFTFEDFQAPTEEELKSSPGFQASLNRASDALQRSAASRGSLLSGSTMQALSDQTADLTTQGYNNLFGQRLTEYSTRRNNARDQYNQRLENHYRNQDSPFAKLMAMSQLQSGQDQYLGNLNLQYAQLGANTITGGSNNYNNLMTNAANSQSAGQMANANPYASLFGNLAAYPWMMAMGGGRRGRTLKPGGPSGGQMLAPGGGGYIDEGGGWWNG